MARSCVGVSHWAAARLSQLAPAAACEAQQAAQASCPRQAAWATTSSRGPASTAVPSQPTCLSRSSILHGETGKMAFAAVEDAGWQKGQAMGRGRRSWSMGLLAWFVVVGYVAGLCQGLSRVPGYGPCTARGQVDYTGRRHDGRAGHWPPQGRSEGHQRCEEGGRQVEEGSRAAATSRSSVGSFSGRAQAELCLAACSLSFGCCRFDQGGAGLDQQPGRQHFVAQGVYQWGCPSSSAAFAILGTRSYDGRYAAVERSAGYGRDPGQAGRSGYGWMASGAQHGRGALPTDTKDKLNAWLDQQASTPATPGRRSMQGLPLTLQLKPQPPTPDHPARCSSYAPMTSPTAASDPYMVSPSSSRLCGGTVCPESGSVGPRLDSGIQTDRKSAGAALLRATLQQVQPASVNGTAPVLSTGPEAPNNKGLPEDSDEAEKWLAATKPAQAAATLAPSMPHGLACTAPTSGQSGAVATPLLGDGQLMTAAPANFGEGSSFPPVGGNAGSILPPVGGSKDRCNSSGSLVRSEPHFPRTGPVGTCPASVELSPRTCELRTPSKISPNRTSFGNATHRIPVKAAKASAPKPLLGREDFSDRMSARRRIFSFINADGKPKTILRDDPDDNELGIPTADTTVDLTTME